ncbi:unannotated protein [freshwater metagenome]|uniref:Unannotated protein n=1 Tax=freshwater metagenome TaxID=449393 RepID=A0A6J7J6Q0_9ZZZZ
MTRSHGEIGHAEVKEQLVGTSLVTGLRQFGHLGEMLVERRVERSFEQMLHHERRREVRTGALALTAGVMEVDLTSRGPDFIALLGRDPGLLVIQGEIDLSHSEA